jgi:hypothetical protein
MKDLSVRHPDTNVSAIWVSGGIEQNEIERLRCESHLGIFAVLPKI